MPDLSGTIYRHASQERLPGAVVKAVSGQGKTAFAVSDDDGDFSLAGLEPGRWRVVALHEDSHASRAEEVDLLQDRAGLRINLFRRTGTRDESAGMRFFYTLLVALAVLVAVYVALHAFFPPLPTAVSADAAEEPGERVVRTVTSSIFWSEEPLRFLEILFWALAGVLVNKIIEVSSYLRWGNFYREGIVMHLSHLVTIPLLVLVTALLLSLVSLQMTLVGGNVVQVNLANPALLAAVSFLLGSRPWSVWKFVQSTAGRFTGREE